MAYELSFAPEFFHGPEGFDGPHFTKQGRAVSLYGAIQALDDEDWEGLTEEWGLHPDTASPEELVALIQDEVGTCDNLNSPVGVWGDRNGNWVLHVYDGNAELTVDELEEADERRRGYNRNAQQRPKHKRLSMRPRGEIRSIETLTRPRSGSGPRVGDTTKYDRYRKQLELMDAADADRIHTSGVNMEKRTAHAEFVTADGVAWRARLVMGSAQTGTVRIYRDPNPPHGPAQKKDLPFVNGATRGNFPTEWGPAIALLDFLLIVPE